MSGDHNQTEAPPATRADVMCGCGHAVKGHGSDGCREWWRYPDVLTSRQCGCSGVHDTTLAREVSR